MQSKKTIILLEFTGLVLHDFTKQNVPNSSYFLGDIKVNGYRGFTIKDEMGVRSNGALASVSPFERIFLTFSFFSSPRLRSSPNCTPRQLDFNLIWGISLALLLHSTPAEPQNQFDIKKAPIPLSVFSRHAFKSHRQSFSL